MREPQRAHHRVAVEDGVRRARVVERVDEPAPGGIGCRRVEEAKVLDVDPVAVLGQPRELGGGLGPPDL